MVSLGEKNYKYFIGYKDDDHKIKSICILLSKTSAYVKRYDGETKWMYFFIADDELQKDITVFEIKSIIVLRKNLTANLSTIKNF